MAQVSKYPLKKEVEEKIFEILLKTIADLKKPEEVNEFLEDFLSPVEKIMLAKRLAIAILLAKGYDYRGIREVLKVTPGTVAGVNLKLKYGGKGYKRVVEKFLREEKIEKLFEKIDAALFQALPPKGRDWQGWRRKKWLAKVKSNQPL